MLVFVLLCHVLAAVGVGPIFTLALLANAPAALRAVLIVLRCGAGVTLVSGILLWMLLNPAHPMWLYVSCALFVLVVATITLALEPAANAVSERPELRPRIRLAGIVASALTLCIASLMVVRPS